MFIRLSFLLRCSQVNRSNHSGLSTWVRMGDEFPRRTPGFDLVAFQVFNRELYSANAAGTAGSRVPPLCQASPLLSSQVRGACWLKTSVSVRNRFFRAPVSVMLGRSCRDAWRWLAPNGVKTTETLLRRTETGPVWSSTAPGYSRLTPYAPVI